MTAQTQTSPSAPKIAHIRHNLSREEKREIACEIFDRISHGEFLRNICSEEGMPHPNTLRNWAYHDQPLASFYACAQKLRIDGLVEELMDLSDAPAPTCKDSRGNVRVDAAAVTLMKHRFEAKRWIFTILRSERSWSDERDSVLTHYPDRPFSPPYAPEPPVHKISEQLEDTEEIPDEPSPEPNSELKTPNSDASASPSPVHKNSDSTPPDFAEEEPTNEAEPESGPSTARSPEAGSGGSQAVPNSSRGLPTCHA